MHSSVPAASPVDPTSPSASSRRPIGLLVLGMHRSGTSALARTINLLGATVPSNLLPANRSNPVGYWESRRVVALHDGVLERLGRTWNDWRALPVDWTRSAEAESDASCLAKLLLEEFPDTSLFVVKDPRACLLLPLWRMAAAKSNTDLRAVIPIREPHEVAASMAGHVRSSQTDALLLWLRYVLDAERGSRGLPRVFVTYDGLLKDWRGVAARIATELEVSWPREPALAARELDAFLDDGHRHHRAQYQSEPLPVWISKVRDRLFDAATAAESDPGFEVEMDASERLFREAEPLLWGIRSDEESKASESVAAATHDKVATLKQVARDRSEAAEAVKRKLFAEREARFAEVARLKTALIERSEAANILKKKLLSERASNSKIIESLQKEISSSIDKIDPLK